MKEQKILHRGFNDGLLSLRGIAAMAVLSNCSRGVSNFKQKLVVQAQKNN